MVDDPFKGTEFMVLEFDPRNAGTSILTSRRARTEYSAYSKHNRHEAVEDAAAAADRARERGLPLRYAVVRIATEEVFPPDA